ncbi:hypothetical protein SAMN05444487_102269 [Marininema mesophilum]|uniref:Uncharacterized protein n=1 Tax=Marininema mesophilum TaxID=1048340 RepID=A0A1H2SP54_9BACL|nr:hypothetical protein [Marininema mesophilum]SDW33382.1 hypothetical protein SAMN05444487_102269 [Marininema mesophilum]
MSIPEFPQQQHRPSRTKVTMDILESIALQEIAQSHLINANADKMQVLLSRYNKGDQSLSLTDIESNLNKFMTNLVLQEWVTLQKLDSIVAFYQQGNEIDEDDKIFDETYVDYWDDSDNNSNTENRNPKVNKTNTQEKNKKGKKRKTTSYDDSLDYIEDDLIEDEGKGSDYGKKEK